MADVIGPADLCSWAATVRFVSTGSTPDVYVYCTSFSESWDAADASYDACVAITNPPKFFLLMEAALHRQVKLKAVKSCGKVFYEGRDFQTSNNQGVLSGGLPAPVEFLKPESHASQQEYRVCFYPADNKPISYVDLVAPDIRKVVQLRKERKLSGPSGPTGHQ